MSFLSGTFETTYTLSIAERLYQVTLCVPVRFLLRDSACLN
jgi:hypothetical protein